MDLKSSQPIRGELTIKTSRSTRENRPHGFSIAYVRSPAGDDLLPPIWHPRNTTMRETDLLVDGEEVITEKKYGGGGQSWAQAWHCGLVA